MKRYLFGMWLALAAFILIACADSSVASEPESDTSSLDLRSSEVTAPIADLNVDTAMQIIHVYVALCDNDSQGIVPVSKRMGNGNDPNNNLYWGNGYGVRTFFNASEDWRLLETVKNPSVHILERCIWKHRRYNCIMVADAWQGARIKPCTIDFLKGASGNLNDTITTTDNGKSIQIPVVDADMVCYVGHDGLMDFSVDNPPAQKNGAKKDVIILACASKLYFKDVIRTAGANPVLWTTNLMGPEAYTLKAAIDGWLLNESGAQIVERAAQAYNQYVKCGIKGARGLFTTGF
jgi:hypothetical protein